MGTTFNITGIWFCLFITLYIILTLHVVRMRWATKTGLGAGEDRRMLKAIRIHGNFAEFIPFVFIGVLLMEMRGASPSWLHSLYAAAFIGRLLIALGISKTGNFSPLRFVGNVLTHVVLLTAGFWNLSQSIG